MPIFFYTFCFIFLLFSIHFKINNIVGFKTVLNHHSLVIIISFFFILYDLLFIIFSLSQGVYFFGLRVFFYLFLCILFANILKRTSISIFKIYVVVFFPPILLSFGAFVFEKFFSGYFEGLYSAERYAGVFNRDVNFLGAYSSLFIIFSLYLGVKYKHLLFDRAILIIASVPSLIMLFLSGSRSALIILLLSYFYIIFKFKLPIYRYFFCSFFLVVFAVILLPDTYLIKNVLDRFMDFEQLSLHIGITDVEKNSSFYNQLNILFKIVSDPFVLLFGRGGEVTVDPFIPGIFLEYGLFGIFVVYSIFLIFNIIFSDLHKKNKYYGLHIIFFVYSMKVDIILSLYLLAFFGFIYSSKYYYRRFE